MAPEEARAGRRRRAPTSAHSAGSTMSKRQSVNDQIPPEARARAANGGFEAKADWYSGRIYQPAETSDISDEERGRRELEAQQAMARRRAADRAAIGGLIRGIVSSAGRIVSGAKQRLALIFGGRNARHP